MNIFEKRKKNPNLSAAVSGYCDDIDQSGHTTNMSLLASHAQYTQTFADTDTDTYYAFNT